MGILFSRTVCRGPNKVSKVIGDQAFKNWLKFTIVLIHDSFNGKQLFKLLSIVVKKKKIKCFSGDFIDNQRSLKWCVQIPGLLRNL